MVRNILAVLAGLGVGILVIMGMEGYVDKIYPAPANLDIHDAEGMARHIAQMPFAAVALMVFTYMLSSFVAGYTASRISKKIRQSFVVGCFLMASGVANVVLIRHPIWMAALFIVLYIPFALLGGKLAIAANRS
ncbi:hypothetical protein [Taibaiella soli]|uniref:Uncharacterized protein n=1 Tax=Taibaiella soli TaxID=1649169 RepID=A0A2W2AZP9_9BACT|nr:hypothetical protein [Taibaiella soli]PZF73504.1 hypothetical protein DN068_07200 [Taibaiella soli]